MLSTHRESPALQRMQKQSADPSKRLSGPLVFGAGTMRTGTNSLMVALEMLLGGRCYHMTVIMFERKSHLELWHRAATQGMTKELADQIFNGFTSCTDFPAAHFYRELAEIYPNAKFVLTVRDPQRWVQSVRATVGRLYRTMSGVPPYAMRLLGISYYVPVHDTVLGSRMGLSFDMTDAQMAAAFERHAEAVQQVIPADRLLVFRVSEGWGPLCKFLGVPVPSQPFPNVNDTAEFQRFVRLTKAGMIISKIGIVAMVTGVVGLAWLAAKYVWF